METSRSTTPDPRRGGIAGVILAAGRSSRMGRAKALLPLPGGTVAGRLVNAFREAGVDPIHVVVGYRGGEIAAALSSLRVRIVWNDLYPLGQTTSLQAGLRSLPAGLAGALLSPADYPLTGAAEIRPLVEAFRQDRESSIFLPVHGGRRGHPLLVGADCFPRFLELPPGEPGRKVVRALSGRIREVEVANDSILLDIDTPAHYRTVHDRLRRYLKD